MKTKSPTNLGYALIGLIHLQPQTGYDLRKVFETTPMGHYSSSPGAIYPALKRLEKDGWIEGQVEGQQTLRPKRVYSTTERGVAMLRRWVSQPVAKDDIVWRDDELMLRFAFMGSLVDDTLTGRFLQQMIEGLDAYIDELEELLGNMPQEGPLHGRLALASGIDAYKARRSWARKAIRHFKPAAEESGRKS